MTITQDNYLDLGNLLIYELFGSAALFVIIGMVIITYQAVKRRYSIGVIVAMNAVFAFAVVSYVYNPLITMLTLLVVGIPIFLLYSKLIKK